MDIVEWNYRVYCNDQNAFGFIEVYYDKDGSIKSYSDFMIPWGESIRDLEFDLEKMAEALNKPTLYPKDMPLPKLKEKEND